MIAFKESYTSSSGLWKYATMTCTYYQGAQVPILPHKIYHANWQSQYLYHLPHLHLHSPRPSTPSSPADSPTAANPFHARKTRHHHHINLRRPPRRPLIRQYHLIEHNHRFRPHRSHRIPQYRNAFRVKVTVQDITHIVRPCAHDRLRRGAIIHHQLDAFRERREHLRQHRHLALRDQSSAGFREAGCQLLALAAYAVADVGEARPGGSQVGA
jgi:hypothetical protein